MPGWHKTKLKAWRGKKILSEKKEQGKKTCEKKSLEAF